MPSERLSIILRSVPFPGIRETGRLFHVNGITVTKKPGATGSAERGATFLNDRAGRAHRPARWRAAARAA
jgi:hypothetical protein